MPPQGRGHVACDGAEFVFVIDVVSRPVRFLTSSRAHRATRGDQGAIGKGSEVRAAPDGLVANQMRARVLSGWCDAWEAGPRSAAQLKKAATQCDRAAALHPAPMGKAGLAGEAARCRSQAEAM